MIFISKFLFYVAAASIFLRPFVSNLAFPDEDYFLWLLLAFSATPFIIINKKRITANSVDTAFLFFGVAIGASLATAADKLNSFGNLYLYSSCFILVYLIRSCDEYQKRILLKTMLFSCFLLCLYGLFQFFFGFRYVLQLLNEQHIAYPFAVEWLNRKRIFATFFSPNAYAGYLTMLAPLFVYVRRTEKKELSARLFLAMMVLCIANLILTFSLGALCSVLLACLCIAALKKQKKYNALSISIAIFVVLLGLLYWRYQSNSALLNPTLSYSHRLLYYREALAIIVRQPWRGIGIGNFEGASSLFVHNSYLQLWIETGFLGFIALLGVIGITVQKGIRSLNAQAGLFCAFLVFAIDNLVSFTFFLPETNWIWWIVVGLIAG